MGKHFSVVANIIIRYDNLYKQYEIILKMNNLKYYVDSAKTKKEVYKIILNRLIPKETWRDVR